MIKLKKYMVRLVLPMLAIFSFGILNFASVAYAMTPTLSFNTTPDSAFNIYNGFSYKVKYDLTNYVDDVSMNFVVKGPFSDPAYGEALIDTDTLIANGSYNFSWDGKESGIYVTPGLYQIDLYGVDIFSNHTNELTYMFTVSQEAKITGASAPSTYTSGTYEISYHLDTAPNACVDLYIDGGYVNHTGEQTTGDHVIGWDGMISGSPAGNGVHTWMLVLESMWCGNAVSSDTVSDTFTIGGSPSPSPSPSPAPSPSPSPSPTPTPPPSPSTYCSGFSDVSNTDPLCPAITYVKAGGIFSGYPDGTFRPSDVINRAETTKVILLGFGKTLLADDGTNLGFFDVLSGSWYMTYLRTAKALGIIQGYPDGTVKPGQQVNRVELLKIFFATSGDDLSGITVFSAPYPDVPIDSSTSWFIKYVQFSKNHALVDASPTGNFYPSAGMKRGDVAQLFYRYDLAGL